MSRVSHPAVDDPIQGCNFILRPSHTRIHRRAAIRILASPRVSRLATIAALAGISPFVNGAAPNIARLAE